MQAEGSYSEGGQSIIIKVISNTNIYTTEMSIQLLTVIG